MLLAGTLLLFSAETDMQKAEARHAQYETLRLKDSYKRFVDANQAVYTAMEEFSSEYNKSGGNVWPYGKAAVLQKAMAELQKSYEDLTRKPFWLNKSK